MYTVEKEYRFSAAHHIDELEDGNPCKRMHGHNYTVTLILQSEELTEAGFVVDVHDLAQFKGYIDQIWDHRLINEISFFDLPPSSENLAKHFYEWANGEWPQVVACRVRETPTITAEYRPE